MPVPQHESQCSKDFINNLQNLTRKLLLMFGVHRSLRLVKLIHYPFIRNLTRKLFLMFRVSVSSIKADTLSISEVGEKVTALNEENFQAASTLGEIFIHKRNERPKKDLEAVIAVSREIFGVRLTNVLITQSQKPEVNPLLVQVILQILKVEFSVSKIQSWYPGDSAIGGFLSAIYSEIRLTGKHLIVRNQVLRDIHYFLEEQGVSGRWRALTRAHTRPSSETWPHDLLYEQLQSLLIVASWAPFSEDDYGDGRQSSGKRAYEAIVGITGIGLGKDSEIAESSATRKDVLHVQNLIPVKIVLWSTLNEALDPIPSTRLKENQNRWLRPCQWMSAVVTSPKLEVGLLLM